MITYTIALIVLTIILLFCIARTHASTKPIAGCVLRLLISALLPVLGNAILVVGQTRALSMAGYILYFIGTDVMLLFLLRYAQVYCSIEHIHLSVLVTSYVLVAIDMILVLLNPLWYHVFKMHPITLNDGSTYYQLDSMWYHYIHLSLNYVLVFAVVSILVYKLVTCQRLYREKYTVILLTLGVVAIWETYYIAANIPIDMSMIGYVMCGILIYYFSIEYVPYFLMDRMLSNIVSNLSDGLLFFDEGGNCIYANDSAYRLFHIQDSDPEKLQHLVSDLLGEDPLPLDPSRIYTRTYDMGTQKLTLEFSQRNIFDRRNLLIGSFLNIQDRTDEERRFAMERYLATHDKLTGLFNADHFYQSVARLLEENPDREYLMIGADIKEFKLINDIYGSRTGDAILVKLARTIDHYATPESVYGRINNDKFGLLMPKDHFTEELFVEGSKNVPYVEADMNFPIVIHIGVYDIKDRTLAPIIMLDRAFLAIASIKNDLEKRLAYYDDHLRDDILWEQKISGSLEEGLRKGDVVPFLQAQVDPSGKVRGAEILVRWNHETEGFLPPGRFIPILEKNSMIVNMDRYIWESACQILAKWKKEGKQDLYLSVNISPKDFYFLNIYDTFVELVEKYELDPRLLRLEITETIVMSDIQNRLKTIEMLRDYGFILEMDDFGSGYSSLSMLKNLPIDVLKIDMKFLYQTDDPMRGRTILDLVIQLAKDLDMPVIAEGVETKEQVDFLTEMGCDMFQGYYFAKPVSLRDFEQSFYFEG
ncbi:MAG: EAL domain-containing protein [Lachnospiraceae bacterium]|nr:EAL domain-containing protein [Lachnospiraceae bacterium]